VVGPEVVTAFREAVPSSLWPAVHSTGEKGETIDITRVNRHRAAQAGLREENLHTAGLCTICRADLCWSWRAHGREAGRMWTLAGRAPAPGSA
jgi:copper oxidase (laccase) domain-containing protein